MAQGITQTQFKTVFAKSPADIVEIAKWILNVATSLSETSLSATDKAVSMSTEVCYGFIRGNSKNVEVNLFVPVDLTLDHRWKESRHTSRKKLITGRIAVKKDLTTAFAELISQAHQLSMTPRFVETNTKRGFLSAVKAMRQAKKINK